MTVEHRILRSDDPDSAGAYDNCLYACRLCNQARGMKPLTSEQARLLDPSSDAWADYFDAVGDSLRPKLDDKDAQYTYRVYDLDSASKQARRQTRRELIADRLQLLGEIGSLLAELLERIAELQARETQVPIRMLVEVAALRSHTERAKKDLHRYAAIPDDAPASCRCSDLDSLALPATIKSQCLELE